MALSGCRGMLSPWRSRPLWCGAGRVSCTVTLGRLLLTRLVFVTLGIQEAEVVAGL